jgi:FkbM family methyltransferase
VAVQELKTIDPLAAAIASLRELTPAKEPLQPAVSSRPLIGPFITAIRKLAWRLAGPTLPREIERERAFQERVVAILRRMEQFMAPTFHVRKDTWDEAIFRIVHDDNEYRLPNHLEPEDIVIDIGMHIGSFCCAALQRGSQNVHGFEAERNNYECAVHNLQPFADRVHCYNQAVFRSDRAGDKLFHSGYMTSGLNTGGGNVFWATSGDEMAVVAFDDVLRRITENGKRRVKLLKIDCEGSEFPILLTSRMLHLIDRIHGEYHELPDEIPVVSRVDGVDKYTKEVIARCLRDNGFEVEVVPTENPALGMFFARNRQVFV